TLPGIRGVLLTTLVLVTIWTFNSFNVIYVLTQGGPMRSTETLIIRIYQEAFSRFDLGASSALTVIAVIILTFLTALYL
ncbi:sugar ABC transporter permease, partial [Aerococcus urinae]|nr:sugar ABC transporter permease [Aerococcus urinae]